MEIKVNAPAKINLSLDILKRRPDGYHEVSMVMQTIDLYDTVTVTENDSKEITIFCDYEGVPSDKTNIVYKAADLFFNYTRIENPGIHINIDKKIPTQAGMAGGSTNGAAVIVALNKMFNTYLPVKTMKEIGARLGADVPFCIEGGTQLATGIGTDLKKIHSFPDCHIVVCKPPVSVSTAEAYSLCDKMNFTHPPFTKELVNAIYMRDIYLITSSLYNDFEVALDLEEVKNVKRIMYKCKSNGACMTGSGSAAFGIFTSAKKAEKCVLKLKEQYNDVFLCKPVKEGCKIVD